MQLIEQPRIGAYSDGIFYSGVHEPPKMAESGIHAIADVRTVGKLRVHFQTQPISVLSNMMWYYEKGNTKAKRASDVMVVRGLKDDQDSYMSLLQWEEAEGPCFIIEFASDGTKLNDFLDKRDLYERLGVEEYLSFDPKWKGPPEEGIKLFRIVPKADEPDLDDDYAVVEYSYDLIQPQGGRYWSQTLKLWFEPCGRHLEIYTADGVRLLDFQETANGMVAAQQKLTKAEQKLNAAEQERLQAKQQLETTEEKLSSAAQKLTSTESWADKMAALLRAQGIDPDGLR